MEAVSTNTKILIIAEVGSVHDGSFGNAQKLIEITSKCGADIVKFQTHIAAAETLPNAPMPTYFKGEPRVEYFERTAFNLHQLQALKRHCQENGIEFVSSPFSLEAVELLEKIGVTRYKIPSGEVTNLPLLKAAAQTGKPILLSSGMSCWRELDEAVNTILPYHDRLTLLQCTSAYPCPPEQVGLNVMLEMKDRYKLPVGFSDHTLTNYASLAAVTLGASVIEKHFTFSRNMYGSDAQHSLEPHEFADLAQGIRAIETMLNTPVNKDNLEEFVSMKVTFEKSIVSIVDIPAGTIITDAMIGFKKPGTGIPTRQVDQVLGKLTLNTIPKDTLIKLEDLADG